MPYCSKCGSKIVEDSIFCEMCGVQVSRAPIKKIQAVQSPVSPHSHVQRPYSSYEYPRRKSSFPIKTIAIIFIVIVAVPSILLGLLFIGIFPMMRMSMYEYLGEQPAVEIPFENSTSILKLDLQNSVGDITIRSDSSKSYFFVGNVNVWGKSEADLGDANRITYQSIGSTIVVEFSSHWKNGLDNPYTYELDLIISEGVQVEIVSELSTGNFDLELMNLNVSALEIFTSTGNQNIILNQVEFPNVNYYMTTSTGNINLFLTNVNYTQTQTSWQVETSTGNIDLILTQNILDINKTTTRIFEIQASTGSISVETDLLSEYGIYVNAQTSLGSINLPNNDDEQYQTANYEITNWHLDFILSTSTGSIYFN
jgi:hypothetical protein